MQAGILARTGNVCYAGILLKYDFGRGASVHPYTAESFLRAMDGRFEDIRGGTVVNPGTAEGRLVGTNLCVCSRWRERLITLTLRIQSCCWKTSTKKLPH